MSPDELIQWLKDNWRQDTKYLKYLMWIDGNCLPWKPEVLDGC